MKFSAENIKNLLGHNKITDIQAREIGRLVSSMKRDNPPAELEIFKDEVVLIWSSSDWRVFIDPVGRIHKNTQEPNQ